MRARPLYTSPEGDVTGTGEGEVTGNGEGEVTGTGEVEVTGTGEGEVLRNDRVNRNQLHMVGGAR